MLHRKLEDDRDRDTNIEEGRDANMSNQR